MYVLGLHGGQLLQHERDSHGHLFHDAAAVLVEDGRVVAAFEEERLDRIKHSNCFPALAIEECLRTAGIGLADVSRIAVNISRYIADAMERTARLTDADYRLQPDREVRLVDLFKRSSHDLWTARMLRLQPRGAADARASAVTAVTDELRLT